MNRFPFKPVADIAACFPRARTLCHGKNCFDLEFGVSHNSTEESTHIATNLPSGENTAALTESVSPSPNLVWFNTMFLFTLNNKPRDVLSIARSSSSVGDSAKTVMLCIASAQRQWLCPSERYVACKNKDKIEGFF